MGEVSGWLIPSSTRIPRVPRSGQDYCFAGLSTYLFLTGNAIPVHPYVNLGANVSRHRVCVCRAGEHIGTVDVVEYEWGTNAQHLLAGRNSAGNASAAGGTGYGVVICADCVYAGASVEPLLASLCEVGDHIDVFVRAYPSGRRDAAQGGSHAAFGGGGVWAPPTTHIVGNIQQIFAV